MCLCVSAVAAVALAVRGHISLFRGAVALVSWSLIVTINILNCVGREEGRDKLS